MTKKEFENQQKEFNNELRDIAIELKELVRDEIGQRGLESTKEATTPSADPENLRYLTESLEAILQQVGNLNYRVRKNAKEFYQI